MWQATAAAIGAMAFCAVVFVAWGLFGRADDTRPRCARCGADARPVAWSEPPVCACGRRLDRAGAVRSSGRARRPRLLMLGAVAGALALATLVAAGALERRGLAWPDVLPLSFITLNADAGRMWAAESIARRHAAGWLDDATLLSLRDRRAGSMEPVRDQLDWVIHARVMEWVTIDGAGVRPLTAGEIALYRPEDVIGLVAAPIDRAAPGSGGYPAARIYGVAGLSCGRIERVLVDGVPMRFEIDGVRPEDLHAAGRDFYGAIRVRPTGPVEPDAVVPRPPRSIAVEILVVISAAAQGVVHDPLIGSEGDPAKWGIDGRSFRLRLETAIESEDAP